MQILLLAITIILSIILFRMLSNRSITYPFIRTTKRTIMEDDAEYLTTESEHGLITIDNDLVIVEGEEYILKNKKQKLPTASLNIDEGKLISICITLNDGEKYFYIDPEYNLFINQYPSKLSDQSPVHTLSV